MSSRGGIDVAICPIRGNNLDTLGEVVDRSVNGLVVAGTQGRARSKVSAHASRVPVSQRADLHGSTLTSSTEETGHTAMLTILPRAKRLPLAIPIAYRMEGDEEWFQSRILNISESGVLFGPTGLEPGAHVEVMLSSPVQIGAMASGRLVCVAEVVRTTEVGAAAARFDECRFLLES